MADIKQIKIGDSTYNLEPYSEYIKPTVNSEYYPKFIQTKYSSSSSNWYGKDYPMYGFWETNTICKITVDNYSTKVDMAVKDADQNVITDTYATKTAVTQEIKDAIDGLIDGAPGTLNTLKELSAAIGDDKDYAATVTNLITGIDTKVTNEKTRAEAAEKTLGEKIGENTNAIAVNANSFKTSITGLSVNGQVITYTKGDGTTGTIKTQDTSDNTHLFRLDTRDLNKGPYDTDNYLSRVTWHLKNNSAIGITGQDSYSGLLQLTPWGDKSGGSSHQLAFGTNGAIYHRYGTTSWSNWSALAHEGWVSSNYATLTSHNTLANAVSTNTTGISTLNTTVGGHTTSINTNATNIAANTTAISNEKSRAEGAESGLSARITTNSDNIEAHGTRLTGAEGNITTLQGYFTNGVANSAEKLTTVSKSAWGKTFWTSNGVPTDVTGDMTKVGSITMGGGIKYKGTKATYDMIRFIDNTADGNGNGIYIGGGGTTIIGGGESASLFVTANAGGTEKMIIANDSAIEFYSNCQSGKDTAKSMTFDVSGVLTAPSFSGPLAGNVTGNVTGNLTGNVTGTADSANWLNTNTALTYGASGLNYFNINGTEGNTKANNTPKSAWYHIIRMNHGNSGGYFADIATPLNDVNGVYWRQVRNGSFYGWFRFLDSNNYNDYSPKLDGTGATGTWGVNITGSAAKVDNSLTLKADGNGSAAGTTYDGSAAKSISYNSIGALGYTVNEESNSSSSTNYLIGKTTVSSGNTNTYYNKQIYAKGQTLYAKKFKGNWSGGNVSDGHVYLTGSSSSSSTGNSTQLVFGTSSNNHVVISSNNNALVINPTTSTTTNQIVLYLDTASVFPSGISSGAGVSATNFTEGGKTLSSKYGALETVTSNTDRIATAESDIGRLEGYFKGGVANEAAKVSKSLTFNADGTGVDPGSTYNGSTATAVSYNTIGALKYAVSTNGTSSKTYVLGKQTVSSASVFTYYNADVYFKGTSVYAGSFYAKSDRRLKENIKDANINYYDFISNIRLVEYNWKSDENKITQHGVIAQELKEVAPEDLKEHLVSGVETEEDYLSVNDGKMVYIALGALKEQLEINRRLEERIAKLEKLLGV